MKRLSVLSIIAFTILTLIFGLYLVYKKSLGTRKTKAAENVFNSLQVSQVTDNGSTQPVSCTGKVCESRSLQLKIKLHPGKITVSCREPYTQCGGTTGLEGYSHDHVYRITPVCDTAGNIIDYQKEDLGAAATCS